MFYLGASFQSPLPWSTCNNSWNTENCSVTGCASNVSTNATDASNATNCSAVTPVEEFWSNRVLQISSGVEDLGYLNWEMVVCLFGAWLLNYLIIWKGVKVSGKIVYFTALFPYAMLLILTVRGITLDGAIEGILFYLVPDFEQLLSAQVWMDAGTQIFFSYAVSTGALIALGSYNKFNYDCYRATWYICFTNTVTSILSGFCVFSVLGFMAHKQGRSVADVVKDGPGLAFIAYPEALSQMPGGSSVWAVLFFIMLVLLGVDSEFVGLEGVFSAFLDMFPSLRLGRRSELSMGVACLLSFVFGLLMCAQGGMYVFQLFDYYSASGFVLLYFCILECFVVAWIYGGQRFMCDIETMIGYRPNVWCLLCWAILAPITSIAIFVLSAVYHEPITYGEYVYPVWADLLGWALALSSMLCVPVYAVYKLVVTPGNNLREKYYNAIEPEFDVWPEPLVQSEIGVQTQRPQISAHTVEIKETITVSEAEANLLAEAKLF